MTWSSPAEAAMAGTEAFFVNANREENLKMAREQLATYRADEENRELQRQILNDELITIGETNGSANGVLRDINRERNSLLSGGQGLVNFYNNNIMNNIPGQVAGTFTGPPQSQWQLDPQNSNVMQLVDAQGNVLNSRPAYQGEEAVNHLIRDYGTSLVTRRNQLNSDDRFVAQLAAQSAMSEDRINAQIAMAEMRGMQRGIGARGQGTGTNGQPGMPKWGGGLREETIEAIRAQSDVSAARVLGFVAGPEGITKRDGTPLSDAERTEFETLSSNLMAETANAMAQGVPAFNALSAAHQNAVLGRTKNAANGQLNPAGITGVPGQASPRSNISITVDPISGGYYVNEPGKASILITPDDERFDPQIRRDNAPWSERFKNWIGSQPAQVTPYEPSAPRGTTRRNVQP